MTEWIDTDGLGGFAMGTVAGLRTRRYHGVQVVATRPPGGRMLGLAALDPVLHARYGERIPVVAVDGEELCELFVDPAAVRNRLDRVET